MYVEIEYSSAVCLSILMGSVSGSDRLSTSSVSRYETVWIRLVIASQDSEVCSHCNTYKYYIVEWAINPSHTDINPVSNNSTQ